MELIPPSRSVYSELCEVKDDFVELQNDMDVQLHHFLGIVPGLPMGDWKDAFVHELLQVNATHRSATLEKLREEARYARTADLIAVTEEDFSDIAHMSRELQQQVDMLFHVCQDIIRGNVSPQQAELETEVDRILESISELERTEVYLRECHKCLSRFLRVLALPEDHFECFIAPLTVSAMANGHELIDNVYSGLQELRTERDQMKRAMSFVVDAASRDWASDLVSEDEKRDALRQVCDLRQRASEQALTQAELTSSLIAFRSVAVESPNVLLTNDGSPVAVCDLISALEAHIVLERSIIELHKTQVDWHMTLHTSLRGLDAMLDNLDAVGVVDYSGL